MIRLPREDGAWYMALTCWLVGWAAALKPAWEPLVVGAAVVSLLAVAQAVRVARRLRTHDRGAARRLLLPIPVLLLVPLAAMAVLIRRVHDPAWIVAIVLPAVLYGPLVMLGEERLPVARLLAVVAITAIAPATYAVVSGGFGPQAAVLWGALGGYFTLGALFVMVRLRPPATTSSMLALVRLTSPCVAVAMVLWAHWVLATPFLILAARAWGFRLGTAPPDPHRVGRRELTYSVTAAIFVIVGVWLR